MKDKKGFTLIELLVVISIIGLLSSIVLASISNARAKARDAFRIQSIKQVQNALELYYNDYGYYPGPYASGVYYYNRSYDTVGSQPNCGFYLYFANTPFDVWCRMEDALKPYISSLPRDPLGSQQSNYYFIYKYNYFYTKPLGGPDMYGLSTILEKPNNISQNDGGYYSNYYEVGGSPAYCRNKYTSNNGNWNYWVSNSTCSGGN